MGLAQCLGSDFDLAAGRVELDLFGAGFFRRGSFPVAALGNVVDCRTEWRQLLIQVVYFVLILEVIA